MSEYIDVAEALARAVLDKQPTITKDGFKGEYEVCAWCECKDGHYSDCPITLAQHLQEIGQ